MIENLLHSKALQLATMSQQAKDAVANRIARAVYKVLAGDKHKELGYQGDIDHEVKIRTLINQSSASACTYYEDTKLVLPPGN
jgi:hypothetical protein